MSLRKPFLIAGKAPFTRQMPLLKPTYYIKHSKGYEVGGCKPVDKCDMCS